MRDTIIVKSAIKKFQVFTKKKNWDHISSKSSRKSLKKEKVKKEEDFLELGDPDDENENPFLEVLNKNSGTNLQNIIKELEPQFVKVYQEIFKTEKDLISKMGLIEQNVDTKLDGLQNNMDKVESNVDAKLQL